ncbi:MAG: NAD-binding protein [Pseudomonadota bacterium]
MLNNVVFLIFRRMRRPLLTLFLVYALAVLGLALIPGVDAEGNPWHLSIFHAFYFVSFMGTTIGLGEIPHAFSESQRIWVMFFIYATVIAWIYAIGTLLALIQDATFQHALAEARFARRIRRFIEPFYLICGYGQTGSELVHELTSRNQHAVVLDGNQQRVNYLRMENLPESVPAFSGDARNPQHLLEAGLNHPMCAGVVALTDDNDANLKIAITSKLLHEDITVICRADSHDVEANMASFGTDYIIDPFDTFGLHLATALQVPGLYLLHEWLTGVAHSELVEPVYPPTQGTWIICGYGRFGKSVYARLKEEGLQVAVIEARPDITGTPEEGCVVGRGTEAETLLEAGVEEAAGLVAGTDDDVNNLSIIMTARELNEQLFLVTRQNHRDNQALFDALKGDMVMHPSAIIANRIRVLLATPLLHEFVQLAKFQEDEWACELVSRIVALVSGTVPDVWEYELTEEDASAMVETLERGVPVTLGDLLRDPGDRDVALPTIPLLLVHGGARQLLPGPEHRLAPGDRLLWCGPYSVRGRMGWTLHNANVCAYVVSGERPAQSWLGKWATRQWRDRVRKQPAGE